MNGPRWVDNNIILQKQRESQYQKHVQKVTQIVTTQKKSHGLDQNLIKQQQSLYNAKSFNLHFNENQRLNQINKQNQMLLDKLIDISEGKQCVIKHQFQHPPQPDKASLRAMSQKRKNAALQIYTENQAMAQRLLNQRSFINKAQIQKEIDEYEKLKAHMQKVKPGSGKKRNVSVQPNHNLPPIIQHTRNFSGYGQSNQKRRLKKVSNSNTLNKSTYDMTHDTSYIYKNKAANQSYLNQSEADIIINQYDTNPIQNSNSIPAYQQSHSANIHNPSNREMYYISNPTSIRGSQHMTPAAILEEDDNTEYITNSQQNNISNQASHFYRGSARASSQINYNNKINHTHEDLPQQHQQNNDLNYSFDKSQNVINSMQQSQKGYSQNKENQPNAFYQQKNIDQQQQQSQMSGNNSKQQTQQQSLNMSQQPSQMQSQGQNQSYQQSQLGQQITPQNNSTPLSKQQSQNISHQQSKSLIHNQSSQQNQEISQQQPNSLQ